MHIKYEVRCINKPDRASKDENILRLGGTTNDGSNWNYSQKEVINKIELGDYFYVSKDGKEVQVIVITPISILANKYLKTKDDRSLENNLLNLPECIPKGLLFELAKNNK